MRIEDIFIQENIHHDTLRVVRDALVNIRVHGGDVIKTNQVLDHLKRQGIVVGVEQLIDMLGQDPMIASINQDQIKFRTPDVIKKKIGSIDDSQQTVSNLARRANSLR